MTFQTYRKTLYAYVTLPGDVAMTTCGSVTVTSSEGAAHGSFSYSRAYLDDPRAVPIGPDPSDALSDAPLVREGAGGLPAALRDACPDAWGRTVYDLLYGAPPNEAEYALRTPDDSFGALRLGTTPSPPRPRPYFPPSAALDDILSTFDAVAEGSRLTDGERRTHLHRLVCFGTSLGGARPKATVEVGGDLWIAKFGRSDDPYDMQRLELATLGLASDCGIEVPEATVVDVSGRSVLLVRRFDRDGAARGWTRARAASGLTLLGADEADPGGWSYPALSEAAARIGIRCGTALLTRATFNALVGNDDDHPRNHAFLDAGAGWRLSPAYDLVPRPRVSHERRSAMALGTEGRSATRRNLLSDCRRFGTAFDEASAEVDRVGSVVEAGWERRCRRAGMTSADVAKVASAFLSPGFRY